MIHEALNNCNSTPGLKLVIVLNENEMSISKNIGSVATSLSKLRNNPKYFRTKDATKSFLNKIPFIGKPLLKFAVKTKKALKNILYGSNYFENLGLYYIGPVDGHDLGALEDMLSEARRCNQSVVVHVKTQKGKGYEPAENEPDKYHALSPADISHRSGFSEIFGNAILEAAKDDPTVCAITAAMGRGTGLDLFEKEIPERFFDVGIAEEHAVTFGAGLCVGGMKPVCAIYSTFLQRSYDNIIHDVALQNLPVIFAIDRAGLNSSDGATHHGIFDVSFLSSIPGITLFTPATYECFERCFFAARGMNSPVAIRYPNGEEDDCVKAAFYPDGALDDISVRAFGMEPGVKNVIITHGRMATVALDALVSLEEEGYPTGILLCEFIKPYDVLASILTDMTPAGLKSVVFLEEEIKAGGFGMNTLDALNNVGWYAPVDYRILAVEDDFVIPARGQTVWQAAGVDSESVYNAIVEMNS
jgi:1-deoxy-D-xylulose-5-phosphate synthase